MQKSPTKEGKLGKEEKTKTAPKKPPKPAKKTQEEDFSFGSEENLEDPRFEYERTQSEEEGFESFYANPEKYANIPMDEIEEEEEEEEEEVKLSDEEEKSEDLEESELNHPAEIAARYLKLHAKGPIGGSDAQILKDLRKMVFGVPLLQQKEVHRLFLEMDAEVYPTVYKILSASSVFWESVIQVIIKVAAGNTYGKNIYEKEDIPLEEKGQKKPYKELYKDHEITFLINSYESMRLFAQAQTTGELIDPILIENSIKKCAFIRGVYEDVLSQFVTATSKYPHLYWEALRSKVEHRFDTYSKQIESIKLIDEKLGLNKYAFSVSRDAQKIHSDYQKLRSVIIAPYLRSVYSAAKKTARNAHQMLDNFQNGSIGLMRAVSCYSTLRPASFASVAKWWIKQMMLLSIKEDANFVKLPVSTWQAYTQLEKARSRLGLGEDKLAEVAEAAKMPVKKAQSIYHTVKIAQVYSLNRTYDHDDKLTLEDVIADPVRLQDAVTDDITELLRNYCGEARLTSLETLVIALRNGMPDLLPDSKISLNDQIKEAVTQCLASLGYNFRWST
jgi:DNA-directed RNA polymerase sigma subunit (sigma70/sigma32)